MPDRAPAIGWGGLALFVAVMLLFRSAIADWNQVPSGSMYPSIYVGDRIVVDKLAYGLNVPFTGWPITRWRDPARGDVVTFRSPEDDTLLVKRVIGLPGDVVALADRKLRVNGRAARYEPLRPTEAARLPLVDAHRYRLARETVLGHSRLVMWLDGAGDPQPLPATRVPAGHFLVLGDNRDLSRDSRTIGFVARERLVGRATRVAFSLDYDRYYAPRLDRFFAALP